ncbi:hypothetical protein QBC34DRAFT_491695 [Podospora aff. communis PSN243]|uniref:Uncharacterized protein n=1 Tax=Podospora aff. communis PSN243 TaxID=3040156 RepID=A0AAV9GZ81_9PEZI|nr:hypothetical protein QBC34DRAFT_491695 [Podospora aff. communis PSN243]
MAQPARLESAESGTFGWAGGGGKGETRSERDAAALRCRHSPSRFTRSDPQPASQRPLSRPGHPETAQRLRGPRGGASPEPFLRVYRRADRERRRRPPTAAAGICRFRQASPCRIHRFPVWRALEAFPPVRNLILRPNQGVGFNHRKIFGKKKTLGPLPIIVSRAQSCREAPRTEVLDRVPHVMPRKASSPLSHPGEKGACVRHVRGAFPCQTRRRNLARKKKKGSVE